MQNPRQTQHSTDIARGIASNYDHGKESPFEHNVEMWTERHKMSHLLKLDCDPKEQSSHAHALQVVVEQLHKANKRFVHHMSHIFTSLNNN